MKGARSAVGRIEELCGQGLPAQELLEEVAVVVARATEAEAFFAGATDPETGLCLGPGVVHNMDESVCIPFWEHELHVPDFNKFSDMGPDRPVADLYEATGGRPTRSARYRAFNVLSDLDAELRMTAHAGGRTWGLVQLNRTGGGKGFGDEEAALLRAIARPLGEALRDALVTAPAKRAARGPGVIVLDGDGVLRTMTREAELWLEELRTDWSSIDFGLPVPLEVYSLALTTARAGDDAPAAARRARLRTRDGVWLVVHASRLGGDDVAVVIEPAQASAIATIILGAYALTPREVEVTKRIARGMTSAQIAAELFLSPHTVRDHVKAIFEKVGVSSRGELTAKLFADGAHDELDDALASSMDRVSDRLGA